MNYLGMDSILKSSPEIISKKKCFYDGRFCEQRFIYLFKKLKLILHKLKQFDLLSVIPVFRFVKKAG